VINQNPLEIWQTALKMSKSSLLLESLKCFFDDPKNSSILLDILMHKKGVSLRALESFITIQSKNDNISYTTKSGKRFVVHVAYKSTLVGYSKKLFDPFCRTERIQFKVGDSDITTTVAQLNFIKWCINNDVIDYMTKCTSLNSTHPKR
jgi:hypothetical protein